MADSYLNIRVDSQVKSQAQLLFDSLGFDMADAVNLFLRQSIRQRGMPFVVSEPQEVREKTLKPGCLHGKIWIADDFDEPLEDFKEYME